MATKAQGAPQLNGVAKKPATPRAPAKKPAARAQQKAAPVQNKAASVAGGEGAGATSAYAIMANRIANRVAEMAESITFVER